MLSHEMCDGDATSTSGSSPRGVVLRDRLNTVNALRQGTRRASFSKTLRSFAARSW